MRKAAFEDEEGQAVGEQAISAKVNALLKEYYPDWIENGCDIRIEKNEDGRPAWTVYVIKNNDDLTKDIIATTFENTGTLKGIVYLGNKEKVGLISKAEAVQIVLKEIRSGKHNILEFDNKEVGVTVSNKEINNKLYYEVYVDKIPFEIVKGRGFRASYLFLVDSDTGECSLVAHEP